MAVGRQGCATPFPPLDEFCGREAVALDGAVG